MQILPISQDFKEHLTQLIRKALKLYKTGVINENLELKSNKKPAIDLVLNNETGVYTNISPVKLKSNNWIYG